MMNEAEAKDRLIDVMRENAELRARVSEIEARYDSVTISLKEKCAELAAIKPAWSDAPDNAEFLTQDEQWTWEFHEVEPHPVETAETEDDYGWWGSRGWCDYVYNKNWRNTLERRPEET